MIEIKCPNEFIDIMPYYAAYHRYYWIEQIDLMYSQYHGLSRKRLQTWLDDKRKVFDSIMKYAEERNQFNLSYISLCILLSPVLTPLPSSLLLPLPSPPPPPLSRFLDISWLIQFHVRRLENEFHQSTCKQINMKANLNDFINNTKIEKRRKFYNKDNKSNMKGKDFKNKYARKLKKTIKRY